MKLHIQRSEPLLPFPAVRAAHFRHIHDERAEYTDEGEVYRLDFSQLLADLKAVAHDDELLDTLVTLIVNSGVHVKWHLLRKDAAAVAALTVQDVFEFADERPDLDMTRRCYHGSFLSVHLESVCKMLAQHHLPRLLDPDTKEKAQASVALLEQQLEKLGLVPNHERIRADFCRNCGR